MTSGSDPWPISSPPIPVYMEPHTRDAPKWTEEVLPKLGWGGTVLQKINYATARVLSLLGGGGPKPPPHPRAGANEVHHREGALEDVLTLGTLVTLATVITLALRYNLDSYVINLSNLS